MSIGLGIMVDLQKGLDLVAAAPRRGRPVRLSAEKAGNTTVLIGLELLKHMAAARRPLALTEIAQQLDMSASRTHRYLSSLLHAGFVRKLADTGHYDMGPATIEIGIAAMERLDGAQVATDIMKDLTNKTGLCSYLCVWGSNGPTVVRSELGSVQTAVRMREGANLSMLTATGQIFHAFMPDAKTRDLVARDLDLWNQVEPEPLTTLEQVLRGRARVQKLRFARSKGMRNPTWTAFSCPVFDTGGEFKMALTIIGVSALFDTHMDGPVARELRVAGDKLSRLRRG